MSTLRSENVRKWRKVTKIRIVESFGGKCCICGKEYPPELFDLHHLDPSKKEKEIQISRIIASPISWKKTVNELRKCVLICANCHRLIHYCSVKIENPNKFNEDFAVYKNIRGQVIGL